MCCTLVPQEASVGLGLPSQAGRAPSRPCSSSVPGDGRHRPDRPRHRGRGGEGAAALRPEILPGTDVAQQAAASSRPFRVGPRELSPQPCTSCPSACVWPAVQAPCGPSSAMSLERPAQHTLGLESWPGCGSHGRLRPARRPSGPRPSRPAVHAAPAPAAGRRPPPAFSLPSLHAPLHPRAKFSPKLLQLLPARDKVYDSDRINSPRPSGGPARAGFAHRCPAGTGSRAWSLLSSVLTSSAAGRPGCARGRVGRAGCRGRGELAEEEPGGRQGDGAGPRAEHPADGRGRQARALSLWDSASCGPTWGQAPTAAEGRGALHRVLGGRDAAGAPSPPKEQGHRRSLKSTQRAFAACKGGTLATRPRHGPARPPGASSLATLVRLQMGPDVC